jgi:hypothetical protein
MPRRSIWTPHRRAVLGAYRENNRKNSCAKPQKDAWEGSPLACKAARLSIPIAKFDDDLQIVWGWASVIEENGQAVIDLQGDVIEPSELMKAAHEFVSSSRQGGFMHTKAADGSLIEVGEVLDSMVFTREVQKALDIDLGMVGWFIGMRVDDTEIWKRIRSGQMRAFSIGATGIRTAAEIN